MEQLELFVSWMREAVDAVSQNASDPKSWGALLAVLVLVSIWRIAGALNRLTRQLSSAVTELSEIRSILKKVERSVEPRKVRPPSSDQAETDILNLPTKGLYAEVWLPRQKVGFGLHDAGCRAVRARGREGFRV